MTNSESVWLRNAILKYIRENNQKVDSIDIWAHFKLRSDLVLNEVTVLEDEGKIRRIGSGMSYVFEVV